MYHPRLTYPGDPLAKHLPKASRLCLSWDLKAATWLQSSHSLLYAPPLALKDVSTLPVKT